MTDDDESLRGTRSLRNRLELTNSSVISVGIENDSGCMSKS